jgi:hypothetical protein
MRNHGQLWIHLTHHGPDLREATIFPHIVYFASLRGTHIRMAFLSRDSRGGVPKLSRFGFLGIWAIVTFCLDLRLGWGLNQSCSFPQELSNGVSHSTCTHRGQVDSRLLMVGSQIVNLIPDPSFGHNLCFRCPNGPCKAIFDIYTSIAFQWYKEHPNARCFDPCNWILKFRESRRTPMSQFRECEFHLHTSLKVGLWH